ELNHKPKLIIGWRAANIPITTDWSEFDIILSNCDSFRDKAINHGSKSFEYFHPGVSENFFVHQKPEEKKYDLSFIGQITNEHMHRINLLTEIAKAPLSNPKPFSISYFISCPNPELLTSGISMHNHGPVFG